MKRTFELALDIKAALAEGPIWDPRRNVLWWVDIVGRRVGKFDPRTGQNQLLQLDSLVGAVSPTEHGDLLVAIQEGFARIDADTGQRSQLVTPAEHDSKTTRFNDGKCDPAGRFIAGSTSLPGRSGTGILYSLNPGGRVETLLRGVFLSNGLAWSLDHTRLYHIDTPTRTVAVHDYQLETGALGERRVAITIPDALGYPDGMTIDAEGMLWIAHWGGHAVTRWDPASGRLLEKRTLPVSQVTSCAFGGPRFDTLYVTTARVDLSPEQLAAEPLAGSLFALEMDVPGVPAFLYRD